ncbi:sugar-binding domain-containing protein [Niabella ginsengisoli]|uniref:Beta-galactosidase galactose-binding domain-containing protein n=1 Tax=Niabella ginsengisoli TaxID=522298 RepID=A0ABS9SHH0_9BACT|nr:sugar-binding domain-containing protein [Niabella ginsengisoli]MCH5597780.1 hypothetical protein [Niabella ginsengisoli]
MMIRKIVFFISLGLNISTSLIAQSSRSIIDFNSDWKFLLGDHVSYKNISFNDASWRTLDLPHDWSIEGKFDSIHPARNAGGALPGGIGWYRKTFTTNSSNKKVYVEFDGVHRNSEVWINGHYLGKWPYGYTSFRYELTTWLKPGNQKIRSLYGLIIPSSLIPGGTRVRAFTGMCDWLPLIKQQLTIGALLLQLQKLAMKKQLL